MILSLLQLQIVTFSISQGASHGGEHRDSAVLQLALPAAAEGLQVPVLAMVVVGFTEAEHFGSKKSWNCPVGFSISRLDIARFLFVFKFDGFSKIAGMHLSFSAKFTSASPWTCP